MKIQRKGDEGKSIGQGAVVDTDAMEQVLQLEEPDFCRETPRGQRASCSGTNADSFSPSFNNAQSELAATLNVSFGHFETEHDDWLRTTATTTTKTTTHFDHEVIISETEVQSKQNAEQQQFFANTNLSNLHNTNTNTITAFSPTLISNTLSQTSANWQDIEHQNQTLNANLTSQSFNDVTLQKVFAQQKSIESVDSFIHCLPPNFLNSTNFKEIFNSFSENSSFNNQEIIFPSQTAENIQFFNNFSQVPTKLKLVTENYLTKNNNSLSQTQTQMQAQTEMTQREIENKENFENKNERPKRKVTQKLKRKSSDFSQEYFPELKQEFQTENEDKRALKKVKEKRPYFVRANHTKEQIEKYETSQKAKKKEKNRELAQLSRKKKRKRLEFLEKKVKKQTELISSVKNIILNCFCERDKSCDCKKLNLLIPKFDDISDFESEINSQDENSVFE